MYTDTFDVILLIVILLIVEIIAIFWAYVSYLSYRKTRDTPTEEIRNLNQGYKEIKGKVVVLEKILESPLSNAPCVYYEFKVEERQPGGRLMRYKTLRDSGGGSQFWKPIIDNKGVSKFGVDDGTGLAEVDIVQASLELKSKHRSRSGILNPLDDIQVAALEKYVKKPEGSLLSKHSRLRFYEKFIKEGDELYVLGDVESRGNDAILMTKKENFLLVSDYLEEELIEKYRYHAKVAGVVAVGVPFILYWLFISL